MTPEEFYADLLHEINVPKPEMDAAREKRAELTQTLESIARRHVGPGRAFGSGALASGTQIQPLNDVDTVLVLERVPGTWIAEPHRAMHDFTQWLDSEIEGCLEISTHAIKITYGDEDFTADVVIARQVKTGILLPECPREGSHRWIASHPQRHAALVRERNAAWGWAGFSRQIRILKHLNREWTLRDPLERKPLSSHHLTALGLEILDNSGNHADMTPRFLEFATALVRNPLPDPAGVGDPLSALDPEYAAALLADAAEKTRRAISAPPDEAERLLTEVFGCPAERSALVGPGPASVAAGGAIVAGTRGERLVKAVRSHGDRS